MTAPVRLSVVVPSHNRRESVLRLLAALRAQATDAGGALGVGFEVIVVADGCDDGTVSALQRSADAGEWPFPLRVLEQSPARGPSVARNAGAAQASGQLLLFVDDDIEPFPAMLATHAAMHADAESRGDWLVVVGAPVPVRPAHPSIHEIAAWGWWEQQFERMGAPGHRFTYDEVFTGVLSMPTTRFREVGGFDTTLGDCHEDTELGLRLFRAGARGAFTRSGGGMHHEVRDLRRLLPRKWAEGRADVRIAQRWPEITGYLTLAGRARYSPGILSVLRWRAFTQGPLSGLITRVALPVLGALDRYKLRATWRRLHGALLAQHYWRGVAAEVGSDDALQRLVASSRDGWIRWSAGTRHLTLDLDHGLEVAEHRLEVERPHGVTIRLGEFPVGEVQLQPTAERLHGGHLRRLLATELARPLGVALALRAVRHPQPTRATDGAERAPRTHQADATTRESNATSREAADTTHVPDAAIRERPDTSRDPVRISVIVPAWNAAPTIARTLDSLLCQTMPEWEAIVVDDGSTDDTAAIVRDYAARDGRIRLVQQANGGVGAARNAGIRCASHDWLHFLDADDWMAPEAFERLAGVVRDHPTLDAVHCAWARVTEDGQLIKERRCWEVGDLFSAFATRCAFVVHACLVRRSAVAAAGGFDASFRLSSDWLLWQRIARLGARFGSVPDVLAFYAHRAGALSNDPLPHFHEPLSIIALGHGRDPRLPTGAHASGRPAYERAEAQLAHACWVAGLLIGREQDATVLLQHVSRPDTVPPPVSVADSLYRGVMHALGMPADQWPDHWSRLERRLAPFLEALERHTGVDGYARAIRVALERLVAPHVATGALVLGAHDVRACEVTAPIADFIVVDGADRLALTVLVHGEPLGVVELPAIDGRVLAVVARDAIADAFAWPILGRFFEQSLYRSVEFRAEGDGWSAWKDGVLLAAELPVDGRARVDALHDIVGWDLFLSELWGGDTSATDDTGKREHNEISVGGWVEVDVGMNPASLSLGAGDHHVVLRVGGAAVSLVPIHVEHDGMSPPALRTALHDAAGFELCRVAVREGLLGAPWTADDTLSGRLARAAALVSAAPGRDGTVSAGDVQAAPGWRRQVQLVDPSQRITWFLARRAGRFMGGSGSRIYALPAEHAPSLAHLERGEGTPFLDIEGSGPARAMYAPSLLWRTADSIEGRVHAPPAAPPVVARATYRDPAHEDGGDAALRDAPARAEQRLPILMYHRIAPDGAPHRRRWRVTPEAFDAQMRTLQRLGFETVTLADWQRAVDVHRTFTSRPVLLTFDDGYADLAEHAWPILRRYGLRALALVVTGSVGRWNTWDAGGESEPLLDWPTLRQLRDEGMNFGAHSVTHRRMTSLRPAEGFSEALQARRQLQEELGVAADTFAYPYGNEDPVQRYLIGAAGFQFGLSVRSGAAARNAPWLSLPRIEVTGEDDLATFQAKLEG